MCYEWILNRPDVMFSFSAFSECLDRAHTCAFVFSLPPLLSPKMKHFPAETQVFHLAIMQYIILLYVFSIVYN